MCTAIDQLLLSLLLSDVPVDLAVVVFLNSLMDTCFISDI